MKQSKKWRLNQSDVKRIATNAGLFFIPVVITELGLFINGATDPKVYAIAFAVWLQGVLIDVVRKANAGK